MSLAISLIPLAIAVNISITSSAAASAASAAASGTKGKKKLHSVETIFMDAQLLIKTLGEHGLNIKTVSDSEYVVETESGILRYFRQSTDTPFMLEVTGIKDMDGLLDSLDALENEYGRNVQKFTYDKVKCSLAEHGMSVDSEEILEDDSILLTLSV